MSKEKVKEITQDLANAIIRGDTMVPVCNVGPLLAYIEELEMKSNGCNEDGWDLYEQQTREAFEFIACRTRFSLKRDDECPWMYAETNTQDCWEMFHKGHVKGSSWEPQ